MIYLDHNATTATLPEVARAMWPHLSEDWGNPSSAYRFGAKIQDAISAARVSVAAFIDCAADEVVFTSGATEANNTAIHAALSANPAKRHVITSRAEHSSVLATCQAAETRGTKVTYLEVDSEGQIDLAVLDSTIQSDTALVSLMWANNETGVLSPVEKIATICRRHGVPFHCDAVQAAGKLPLAFRSSGIDYLSITGHKFGAPKGVGALAVRSGSPFTPLITGGKQQQGRRGGTESVPLVVALGAACEIARLQHSHSWDQVRQLRDELESRILSLPGAYRNGAAHQRLPNTLNFGISGVDSDGLVAFFDRYDICVSSGSACMENALAPSHVIMAMRDYQRANEALRVSLGPATLPVEIDRFWEVLCDYLKRAVNRSATESTAPSQSLTESLSRTS